MSQACPSAEPEPDFPRLDFDGTTPYESYVCADVLTHLQQPRSDDPGEFSFLVTTQVMELWFTAIVHEWTTAARALRADDLPVALAALRRSGDELRSLNASWEPLGRLTPGQFNAYRAALGEGSGFQSAMYRRMEFLLGEKSAAMLVPHRGVPRVHAELTKALHEPGLYDEALGYLHRNGQPLPDEVRHRDFSARYEPHPAVEAAWQAVYAAEEAPGPVTEGAVRVDTSGGATDRLLTLGEALTDVAEQVTRWRAGHLMATRRAMGGKTGTGGSPGVAWLEKRASKQVFPELWTARSHV